MSEATLCQDAAHSCQLCAPRLTAMLAAAGQGRPPDQADLAGLRPQAQDLARALTRELGLEQDPEAAARAWTLGPEVLYPAPIAPVDIKAMEEDEEKRGAEILDKARADFEASGLLVRTMLRRGDAATETLELAREEDIDLLVCGSRGLNPVSGWLLGSVSRKLVHYAPCSVLIVK